MISYLQTGAYRQTRHRNGIPSKRKRIPVQDMLSFPDALPLEMGISSDGSRYLSAADESHNNLFVNRLQNYERLTAVFPCASRPPQRLFSRFLLKIGIEYLGMRMLPVESGIQTDHIENPAINEARRYVRFNEGGDDWPFHECQIYSEGRRFRDAQTGEAYDVPHEFTLLYTENREIFFVIAIFGTQYTINLGGPEIDGFLNWLSTNDNSSPLYTDGT